MADSVETNLVIFVFVLAIMKLLRMDLLSKYLLFISLSIFALIASIGMGVSIIGFPFVMFGSSNETLGLVLKIGIPVVTIIMYFLYQDDIHEFIYGLKIELKNDMYRDRTFFSSIAKNSLVEALKKYLKIIKNDIENKFIYNLGFFVLYYIFLIDLYSFEHIMLVGPLEDFGIYFISKLHLIWLIPLSFLFTYIYSRFYYDFISERTYEKLVTISKFIEHDGNHICLGENEELVITKIDAVINSYKFSETITMIELNNKIYYLLKNADYYQTFKASYIFINNYRNKFIYELKYYRENFE
jgi:hypothetical protein